MESLARELRERFDSRLKSNELLAPYTSFQIGGPADLMLAVESEDELCVTLSAAHRHRVPVFCLGGGTNVLVSDRGVRGLVIKLGPAFAQIQIEGTRVSAGSAAMFRELVDTAVAAGLAGLEFGEGIPGTVGGGLLMNAGAFGGEMSAAVAAVRGVNLEGQQKAASKEQLRFDYRHALLPEELIITTVDFALRPGDKEALRAHVMELRARRAARQPLGIPNAGSIFKNPPGMFAARLLEECRLKNRRIGMAAFSERHANFIVNLGGAKAADVRELIETAQTRVHAQAGVRLEPEVKLVGEW
jgi:UDP-N-acetylmuramate dehydrogenase